MSTPALSARSFRRALALAATLASVVTIASTVPVQARPRPAQGPPPAWVTPVALPDVAPAAQGRAGVEYLLLDRQVRVEGKSQASYVHGAKRIVNQAGLDSASQFSMQYDPACERVVLHRLAVTRDGVVSDRLARADFKLLQREPDLEAQVYDGRVSLVTFVEDLRVGDVLEYAYSRLGANPVFEGRYSSAFSAGWSVPVRRAFQRLLFPAGRPLYLLNHGTSIAPHVRPLGAHREYVWQQWEVPALSGESDLPGWYDDGAWVQATETESWAEVAQWAGRVFDVAGAASPEIESLLARWASLPDPSRRALAAARFVQDEVRYVGIELGAGSHRPSPPALVVQRRFGDCKDKALLLVTLLRRLGIAADVALVHSTRGRALDDWLPSGNAFDHAVVRLNLNGRPYWIDATLSAQGGRLEETTFPGYERALLVAPGSADLVSLSGPAAEAPLLSVREELVVPGLEGEVSFRVETRHAGVRAEEMRRELLTSSREEIGQSYVDYYRRIYPSLEAVHPLAVEDDRDANVLVTREVYRIRKFWPEAPAAAKQAKLFPATLNGLLRQPEDLKRSGPYTLGGPTYVHHSTEIVLPKGWEVGERASEVKTPDLVFSARVTRKGERAVLDYDYRLVSATVPADRLAEHVKKVRQIESEAEFVLQPPVPAVSLARRWLNWPAIVTVLLGSPLLLLACLVLPRRIGPLPAAPSASAGASLRVALATTVAAGFALLVALDGWGARASYRTDAWERLTASSGAAAHALWAPLLIAELLARLTLVVGGLAVASLAARRRRAFRFWGMGLSILAAAAAFAALAARAAIGGAESGLAVAALRFGVALGLLVLGVPWLAEGRRLRALFSR